jgi:hypothetical protein
VNGVACAISDREQHDEVVGGLEAYLAEFPRARPATETRPGAPIVMVRIELDAGIGDEGRVLSGSDQETETTT